MTRSIFALMVLFAAPVCAQELMQNSDQPIEITGQQSLEWDRDAQLYKALGGAKATQGTFSVSSDNMTAKYQGDQSNLTTLDAVGNVVIDSEGRVARGDNAVYDIATGNATLTGGALSLTTPDLTVTAKDKFTVNTKTNNFDAYGAAVATQTKEKRQIKGEHLNAVFAKGADGKTALSSMTAMQNVSIAAGEDTVHGDKAVYNALTKQAEVTGKTVTLNRGPNVLTGERATVDMNTNVSHLYGGAAQPAKAVFYPKSKSVEGVTK